MKDKIINGTTRFLNNSKLKIEKHSPEILMGLGIVGVTVSTVIACKKTLKVNDILEEKRKTVDNIHECLEAEDIEYTQEDANKDLTIVYTQTGVKLFKLYLPAIALGALSITSIVAGHTILKKRNVALMAAYAIIDRSFKRYRSNVVERFGEEIDNELRYNVKTTEIITKDEKGKEKKEVVKTTDGEGVITGYSDYAKFFDASCEAFTKDPEFNLMFLRRQQDFANEKLKCQGHLFLNEVYDMLDIPRTKAGQVVGWIYDPKNKDSIGDNYVDFGIYKNCEPHRRFVNGLEQNILLDFNVDGVIYDLI